MSDVRQWLEQHGLGKYAELFAENEIDFEVLPELEEVDLEKIGLALGPRKKLLKAIREIGHSRISDQVGDPLARPGRSGEAERRQLTVVFSDLAGSTELSRELDPEDLRDINRTYQDAATAAIEQFGGYVARYMGDGVLAYFGYPRAHEDDAERALRAGLVLVESLAKADTGIALAVRVGVATGPVVVGDIIGKGAAQESAVVGETPNLAARLQGIAEPNTVVLSQATQRLVTGRFDVETLEPRMLKGITEPVQAYRALAVRNVSRFEALRERRLTPLVGREEELEMLLRRWKLAKDGEGQAVLLSGEAGVGKSRIVGALRDSLGDFSTNRVFCYCSPYHQSSAFRPLTEYIERAIHVKPGQTPGEKLHALENVIAGLGLGIDDTVPFYAELLSLPYDGVYPSLGLAPEQLRLRTLDVLTETIEAMTVQAPVLFVLEDAHWIDPSTQDFLTQVIERVRTSRALIVITYRPEFEPRWSHYSHVTAIALNNLGRRDTAAMVNEVTRGKELPESTIEEIIRRTDGIPLFIEEITATLSDSGIDTTGDEAAASPVDSTTASIPVTLQDLLMERLDKLGTAKEAAQHAAVIGRSFTFDLLKAVSGKSEQALERDLATLVQSGLVYGRRSAESGFEFKHALVCDAAYQTLLKRDRQRCHERIATVLSEAPQNNPPLELIARHFDEGGHFDKAARYWRQAGERALGQFAHVEAISNFQRALAAVEPLAEERERYRFELETHMLLGPCLMYVKGQGAPEAEQTYVRALALAGKLADAKAAFTAAWGMWRLQFARADMRAGQDYASKCLDASAGAADPVADLGAAFALGATALFSGECAAAAPHLNNSIALYRGMEDKTGLAAFGQDPGLSSLCYLSWARWLLGYPDQAVALSQEALQLAREIGKPVLIAVATGFAGLTHALLRDIPKLTEYAQECHSLCDQYEFRQHGAMSNVMLGYAYSQAGNHDRAPAMVEDGIAEKLALQSHIALPWFCYMAAETYMAAGRPAEALDVARKGIDFAARGGERFFEPENHRVQALALARKSGADREEIEGHFDDALELARSQKAKALELRAALSFARFSDEHGARDHALALLSPIYESFTEGFDTPDLEDARTLLEQLS